MKNSEFVAGEIYSLSASGINYILRAIGPNKSGEYINITAGYFDKNSGFAILNTYEIASEEEREWLLACVEKGKFIPKEEALKHYNNYQIF